MDESSDWVPLLGRYARQVHAIAGDEHHVVSPLGAWMVLALCGRLAEAGDPAGDELAEILGDPAAAASFAASLLVRPHPLVSAGAGLWVRAHADNGGMRRWRAGWPEEIDTGEIPSQEKLDRWVFERTSGLIERFPLTVAPDVVCLLASALATRVSWEVPFEVVEASEMGPSRWAGSVTHVLKTPPDPRHQQFLTETPGAGPVAVHLARARGGLTVGSVIAAGQGVPAASVLGEAERIVTAEARQPGSVPRRSLFDEPLGPGPAWNITEEPIDGADLFDDRERFTSVLPAWSADTNIDLSDDPGLGFGSAAAAISRTLERRDWTYQARQTAVARYSAIGFEAAAVTALAVRMAARRAPSGLRRRAVIRFRHPYAVVAATCDDHRDPSPEHWHGLPVFSAWIARADDADPSARTNSRAPAALSPDRPE